MIGIRPLAFFSLAGLAGAQTSELFLTSYGSTAAYVVQNGQIVRQFNRTNSTDGPALVVQGTIKMFGQAGGNVGREYDLNGNLLAGSYLNAGFTDCYDGATDGTRNWTISHNDFGNNFAVLVGDSDWGNVQVAFVPSNRSAGITYDATDDTLWVLNTVCFADKVQHYDTAGNFLGEFAISINCAYGIALDPADQTLWIPESFGTQGNIHQYDKSGNFLQTVNVTGLDNTVLGAEFGGLSAFVKYCTANNNSTGAPADLTGSGSTSSSAGTLTLTSQPVPDQNSIFFHGMNQSQNPFGNGFMCTTGGIVRGAVVMGVGNIASYTYDNSDAKHSVSGFVGTTRNFQHWFRDPMGGGAFFNLSNALSIAIAP
jgi:hypothetical protein